MKPAARRTLYLGGPGMASPDLSTPPPATIRRLLAVAASVAVVTLAVVLGDPGGTFLAASYAIPGLVLALRRPSQPIAWCLLVMAAGFALGTVRNRASLDELRAGEATAMGAFTAWANGTGWTWVFIGLLGILLLFPGGHLARPRLRVLAAVLVGATALVTLGLQFGQTLAVSLASQMTEAIVLNPYALAIRTGLGDELPDPWPLWLSLFVIQLVAVVPFGIRFRASTGLERLQFRWLAWAVLCVTVASAIWAVITYGVLIDVAPLAFAIVVVSYPAIPIAVVVAVLRYRLYEIDRLVSRTLGWGLASASVAVVFATTVLTLQALLAWLTQGQTLATAGSTLLAAAAFQPIRRRAQAIVNGRFDRPRVEAEQSLAAYGSRIQHEMDLATLTRDVEQTVHGTLRPSTVGVWIRGV